MRHDSGDRESRFAKDFSCSCSPTMHDESLLAREPTRSTERAWSMRSPKSGRPHSSLISIKMSPFMQCLFETNGCFSAAFNLAWARADNLMTPLAN
jgi:hypothetical protein